MFEACVEWSGWTWRSWSGWGGERREGIVWGMWHREPRGTMRDTYWNPLISCWDVFWVRFITKGSPLTFHQPGILHFLSSTQDISIHWITPGGGGGLDVSQAKPTANDEERLTFSFIYVKHKEILWKAVSCLLKKHNFPFVHAPMYEGPRWSGRRCVTGLFEKAAERPACVHAGLRMWAEYWGTGTTSRMLWGMPRPCQANATALKSKD